MEFPDGEKAYRKLNQTWRICVTSENDLVKRNVWLDVFLANLIHEFKERKDIVKRFISDFDNIANAIASEFISNIHEACTEQFDDDELGPLRKYLLQGRGWRFLIVFQFFELLDIECNTELSSLLLSLYSVVENEEPVHKITNSYVLLPEFSNKFLNIDDVIQYSLTLSKKSNKSSDSICSYIQRNGDLYTKQRYFSNMKRRKYIMNYLNKQGGVNSVTGSEISDIKDVSQVTNYTNDQQNDQSASNPLLLNIEDYKTESIRSILEAEINSTELRILVLQVLKNLCLNRINHENQDDVILQTIKFCLENLCSLQFRPSEPDSIVIFQMKDELLNLLLISINRIKINRNTVQSITSSGTISIFLQLLKDVNASLSLTSDDEISAQDRNFLYGCLFGLLNLLFQILKHELSFEDLKNFVKLYQLFVCNSNGKLVEKLIKNITNVSSDEEEKNLALKRSKIIFTLLGYLIYKMKKIRYKIKHLEGCGNLNHKQCLAICKGYHHHHSDIFGKMYTISILSLSSLHENCCISSTVTILLKILLDNNFFEDKSITTIVLQTLNYSGVCCCIPLSYYLPKLVKFATTTGSDLLRHLILNFLENVLYPNCGIIDNSSNDICFICSDRSGKLMISNRTIVSTSSWKFFDCFKDCLTNENPEILKNFSNHLLKNIKIFVTSAQHYFIFNIFYEVFENMKNKYLDEDEDENFLKKEDKKILFKESIIVCLSLFSDIKLYDKFLIQFDNSNILNDVLSIIEDDNFSKFCYDILIARILSKIFKLERASSSFTPAISESCSIEMKILFTNFEKQFCSFLEIYNMSSTDDDVNPFETDDISKILIIKEINFDSKIDYMDYLNILNRLSDLVATFENLILQSNLLKLYFRASNKNYRLYTLLIIFLKLLSVDCQIPNYPESNNNDLNFLYLKIIKSLIVVCLSIFIEAINVIESNVKNLLDIALNSTKVSVKQICDVLLTSKKNSSSIENNKFMANEIIVDENFEVEEEIEMNENFSSDDDSLEDEKNFGQNPDFHRSLIFYPTACTITVELLNSLSQHYQRPEDVQYCLQRIVSICKLDPALCLELAKQGIVSKLFDKLIIEKEELIIDLEDIELQSIVIELISILICYHVEDSELRQYFRLFKCQRPPINNLLLLLLKSINRNSSLLTQPIFYLQFPCQSSIKDDQTNFDKPAEALSIRMKEIHKQMSLITPWSIGGLVLPINTDLDWSIWFSGFSLSFWLKSESPVSSSDDAAEADDCGGSGSEKPRELIHLISIGYDLLLVEIWLDTNKHYFHVKLTRPDGNSFEILSEISYRKSLNPNLWHHIGIRVKDSIKRNKIVIGVSIIIDGLYEETHYLKFIGIFMRKSRPACVLIGDTRTNLNGRFSFSNLMMFKSSILSKNHSIVIRSYGPDMENLLTCKTDRIKPYFENVLINSISPENFSKKFLEDNFLNLIKELRNNLLLSFSARDLKNFIVYSSAALSQSGVTTAPSPAIQTFFKKSKIPAQTVISECLPNFLNPIIFSELKGQFSKTILVGINNLGGVPFLLFLFAKIVDICSIEETQAAMLNVLLKFSTKDVFLKGQFENFDCYTLISEVITSSRYNLGMHTMKALLDSVLNKSSILQFDENNNDWSISASVKNEIFIINTRIITRIILHCWQAWEKIDPQILTLFFRILKNVIDENHPFRNFNLEQINHSNIISTVLNICTERCAFATDSSSTNVCCINEELCYSILDFIKTVLGSPPSLNLIQTITQYLISAHPTSLMHITHMPSAFYYFTFTSTTTNSSTSAKLDENISVSFSQAASSSSDVQSEKVNKYGGKFFKTFLKSEEPVPDVRAKYSKSLNLESESTKWYVDSDFLEPTDTNICPDPDGNIVIRTYSVPDLNPDVEYVTLNRLNRDGTENSGESMPYFYNYISGEGKGGSKDDDSLMMNDCGQYILTNGLLLMLHDTILVLPDSMVDEIFNKIIKPEIFLILSNHPNRLIRSTVIKVLLSYLSRCSVDESNRFVIDLKGFYHLANQIASYSANEEIVNCCIDLLAKCHWMILEQWSEIDEICFPTLHFNALPPILALLPKTVNNVNLARNLIRFFHSMIHKVHNSLKKLVDHCFIECLIKMISALIHIDCSDQSNNILLNDIMDVFNTIVNFSIHTTGIHYLQILNDVIYKCRYLEVTEEAVCGSKVECVNMIHNLHCSVLKYALDDVHALVNTHYSSQDNMDKSIMSNSMSTSMSSIPSSIMSHSSVNGKTKSLSKTELVDRYKLIINRASDYLQFSSSNDINEKDMTFACHLFTTLIYSVSNIASNRPYIRIGSPWSSVFWSARETLRQQAANMMIWLMSPARPISLRIFAVETLLNERKAKEVISSLLVINSEIEQRFIVFLWHLMYSKSSDLSADDLNACEELKNYLQTWDVISPQAIGHAHDRWQFEVMSTVRELSTQYWDLEKTQRASVYKCVYKWDILSKKISESALSISSMMANCQGKQRKKMLNLMREKHRFSVQATVRWRTIIKQMTHERAPWHDPEAYPRFWELDPCEGPTRVRKKLRRCKVNIDKKFMKPEYTDKINEKQRYPLSYLFESTESKVSHTLPTDNLPANEKISYMVSSTIVQPSQEVDGELLIGENTLYFIAVNSPDLRINLMMNETLSHIIQFTEIKEVHNRRYELKERAIEIFLLNGKTYFVAFASQTERDNFVITLSKCSLPNRIISDMLLSDSVEMWREGHMSNWEYLKGLNKMAGRSYNDLMQYPVMPFILADYESNTLDLLDEKIYRNLKKPMAVQDKKKETYFINHFNYLKAESTGMNLASLNNQPYHYASHYSNSGTVLHFLVRLPPFTQIFLRYQDNNFDLPDRTFHSLETTWRLTSSESTSDVKELIPEFFYLPEFLMNSEGFNFGIRQNGEPVDNVKLPRWSKGDARIFILVHRQLLESEFVKENLPHWIDLVFGYKQTGKAAIDAINVFHPATYSGFNVDSIPDELERTAWETMVRTYGQTPRQLFKAAHPMVIQNLLPTTSYPDVAVIEGIKGLKWGSYVGSPAEDAPIMVWNNSYSKPIMQLVPLLTNDVFGLPSNTSLLSSYNKERSVNLVNEGVTLVGGAMLSWDKSDGIIYIKQRKEQPPVPVIFCPPRDPVIVCSTAPDCSLIWVGLASGNIEVFTNRFNVEAGGLIDFDAEPAVLLGHAGKIRFIYISVSFGIVLSGGEDGCAIIWDLNNISYVRSLPLIDQPICVGCVSSTMGDIATVGHLKGAEEGSVLRLHTINGSLIGSINAEERIMSVCFSTAMEGVSVNVVAVGLDNGLIKLFSTWDMSLVTVIQHSSITSSIIALTYSHDSQYLYCSTCTGAVFIWERPSTKGGSRTPKFFNLSSVM